MGEKEKFLLIIYYIIAIIFIWLFTDPEIWRTIINSISKPIK
jgi:hypothetical protein